MGLCISSIHSECCFPLMFAPLHCENIPSCTCFLLRWLKTWLETHFPAFCHFPFLAIGSKIVKSAPVTTGRLFSLGCRVNFILTFQCLGRFLQYLSLPHGKLSWVFGVGLVFCEQGLEIDALTFELGEENLLHDLWGCGHHVEQNASGEIKIRIWLCTEICIFDE